MSKAKNRPASNLLVPLALTTTLLASCDPVRVLVVKAANKPEASVAIYANKSILPWTYNGESEKIIISVPEMEASIKRDTTFYYGLGTWSDESLMPGFSKNIDSIVIVSSRNTTTLSNQADINDYLLKHRHGFAKSKLTIEAE